MVYELNGIPEDENSLFRAKYEDGKFLQPGKKSSFSNQYFSAHARLKLFILKKALGFSDRIIAVTPGIKVNLEKVYNIPGRKNSRGFQWGKYFSVQTTGTGNLQKSNWAWTPKFPMYALWEILLPGRESSIW